MRQSLSSGPDAMMNPRDSRSQRTDSNVKAVLFDLDDTLTDHQHCSRAGLIALQSAYPCLARANIDHLVRDNLLILNDCHRDLLAGRLSGDDAKLQKYVRLFDRYGQQISRGTAEEARSRYEQAYAPALRPVPGAIHLLEELRARGLKIAVLTNNLVSHQVSKILQCGLDPLIDVLVISEEVGLTKPDPAIFHLTLERSGCGPREAVMVGDSWESDILGALAMGVRAVWLNRYGFTCPDPGLAPEFRALLPLEPVLTAILGESEEARNPTNGPPV
jgi:putative hydrolase of the HAD superfamily